MSGATNNGTSNQAVGAIYDSSPGTGNLTVDNSAASTPGLLTVNGATINGISNTILANTAVTSAPAPTTLSINNGAGTSSMGLVLGGTTNVIQAATVGKTGGGASSQGDVIAIGSNISEFNSGSSLTFLAAGTSAVNGGVLELNGTNNTFSGGMTIGNAAGTQAGTLQVAASDNLPAIGNILIEPNSQFLLNAASTSVFGSMGQTLTLNGVGTIGNSGALRQASGITVTWQGSTALGSNSVISATGSAGQITLSGPVNDNGFQLQKQGAGNLVLSSISNVMTGSTQIGNGTLTVNSGSSMGTGDLSMAQTSTNNTLLILNNTAQTVGNLNTSWTAVTGTQSQVISLNGTALTVTPTTNDLYGTGAVSTLTGTISGPGSLTIAAGSPGTLTLTGANSYGGATNIDGGALYVNGSHGSSGSQVSADYSVVGSASGPATLGGTGNIFLAAGNSVNAAGITGDLGVIAPGTASATGTLTVDSGNVSFAAGSELAIRIDAGSHSELVVSGAAATVTLGSGVSALCLSDPTNATLSLGTTLTIVDASLGSGTVSGTFLNEPNGSVVTDGVNNYQIAYYPSTVTLTVVPEPSTIFLAALALLAAPVLARIRAWGRKNAA